MKLNGFPLNGETADVSGRSGAERSRAAGTPADDILSGQNQNQAELILAMKYTARNNHTSNNTAVVESNGFAGDTVDVSGRSGADSSRAAGTPDDMHIALLQGLGLGFRV
jgi:hypothetical protein